MHPEETYLGVSLTTAACIFLLLEREHIPYTDGGARIKRFMTIVEKCLDGREPDWRTRYAIDEKKVPG